jgi:hypothetical protein
LTVPANVRRVQLGEAMDDHILAKEIAGNYSRSVDGEARRDNYNTITGSVDGDVKRPLYEQA